MNDPKEILQTEFSEPFIQGMKDRMVVSYFKYGPVEKSNGKINYLASLRQRLQRYEETGNTEWLMDVGNFAMIEYMLPQHPKAHFRGTDAHESPGRIDAQGQPTKENNGLELRLKRWNGTRYE